MSVLDQTVADEETAPAADQRSVEVDALLRDAVDMARTALIDIEQAEVGDHLGFETVGDTAGVHRFDAALPGYRGWQWAVVVAAAPGAEEATVSETALLPGPDAILAPQWIPWEDRLRPGDLSPGALLPHPTDDPRLEPGYVATGDLEVDEVAYDLGLGRPLVMSREGRLDTAERWVSGDFGPDSDMAKAAPGHCRTCGFFLSMAGIMKAAFGVCGNELAADGHVVHVEYGCGAHSRVQPVVGAGSPVGDPADDYAVDALRLPAPHELPAEEPEDEADAQSTAAEAADPARGDTPPAETATVDTQAADTAVVEAPGTEVPADAAPVGSVAPAEAPATVDSEHTS